MAKRELIDKKAFIDRSAIEFVSLEDSLRYMEWSKNNEVQLEMVATTITEHEIVKPYLDKISAEIEEVQTYDGIYIDRAFVLEIINKYETESEG